MQSGGLRHVVKFIDPKDKSEFTHRADVQERQEQMIEAQGEYVSDGVVKVRMRWDENTDRIEPGWTMRWRNRNHTVESAADPHGRRRVVLVNAVRRA